MKKKAIVLGLSLLTIILSACGGQTKNSDSSENTSQKASVSAESTRQSTTSETSISTKETTTAETTNSSQKAASASAGNSEKSAPDAQATTVLQTLEDAFPNQGLPQAILTSKTAPYLTAATTPTQDQANFRILYYAEQAAIAVNDLQVNQLTPIAAFEKKTYNSPAQAQAAVQQNNDDGGQAVDLGHGIIGHQQGAAGSSYLTWQEGNWRLLVQASNVQGENPQPLAKQIVDLLEKEMLPAPKDAGRITLSASSGTDYQQNAVVWQENNVVYTIHHFDPVQAIKMATSIEKSKS
ncbi:hypothetical protein ACSFB8_08090 [Enterococcus faecalis]